jgi:putative transposase
VPHFLAELEELGSGGFGYEGQRWTTQRVADAIARLTDIYYSKSSISELLKKWRWSWQKPKRQGRRRDEAKTGHWREELWPTLKKKLALRTRH